MTTLTVGGYTIGNLDQAAGVQAAAQAYTDNPTNSTLAAYDAALANAAAALELNSVHYRLSGHYRFASKEARLRLVRCCHIPC